MALDTKPVRPGAVLGGLVDQPLQAGLSGLLIGPGMEILCDATLSRRSLTTSARGDLNASSRTTYRAVLNDIARPAGARPCRMARPWLWPYGPATWNSGCPGAAG
jgi:hypothetical protein